MKWFGESWGAPCCRPEDRGETPAGTPCRACKRRIDADDQGFLIPNVRGGALAVDAWHLDCMLRHTGVEPPKHVSGLRAAVQSPGVRITNAPADARVTCTCGTSFRVGDAAVDPSTLHPICIACERVVGTVPG